MKNYVSEGDNVTITAPTGGVVSGQCVLVGSLFGVSSTTAAAGDDFVLEIEGVYDLPSAAVVFTVGALAYWDATAGLITTIKTGNTVIGVAVAASATTDGLVRVKLNESYS